MVIYKKTKKFIFYLKNYLSNRYMYPVPVRKSLLNGIGTGTHTGSGGSTHSKIAQCFQKRLCIRVAVRMDDRTGPLSIGMPTICCVPKT